MTATKIWFFIVCGIVFSQTGIAQQPETYTPEKGSTAEKKPAQWAFKADPKLPNVLILGDSISIGYTLETREQLKGKANVFRPIKKDKNRPENCSGTINGIRHIDRWLAMQKKWDVIHFNWGLHDLKHIQPDTNKISNSFEDPRQAEPEAYRRNLEAIVKKLKATGAKLIFATTTPYPAGCKPARLPADADLYNDIATEVMKANHIQINDLNKLVKGQLGKLQNEVNVHFNAAGNKVLSKKVASVIEVALDNPKSKAPLKAANASPSENDGTPDKN